MSDILDAMTISGLWVGVMTAIGGYLLWLGAVATWAALPTEHSLAMPWRQFDGSKGEQVCCCVVGGAFGALVWACVCGLWWATVPTACIVGVGYVTGKYVLAKYDVRRKEVSDVR